jgi:hypothetical protein
MVASSVATTQLLHAYGVPIPQLCKFLMDHQVELEAAGNYKGAKELEENLHAIKQQEAIRQVHALQAKQLLEVEELEKCHRKAVVSLQQQWDSRLQGMAQRHSAELEGIIESQMQETRIFEQACF